MIHLTYVTHMTNIGNKDINNWFVSNVRGFFPTINIVTTFSKFEPLSITIFDLLISYIYFCQQTQIFNI
jgi:hypothetical protein